MASGGCVRCIMCFIAGMSACVHSLDAQDDIFSLMEVLLED
jgi:hypothetical protein